MKQIKDIMTADVEVVSPDTTIREAAQRMRDLDVGSLPVCDGNRLLGMVTDRDITIRATAQGMDPTTTHAFEAMTQGIVYCFEDQQVEEAAKLMGAKQIRRLPVLNRDKQLVGILSLGDLSVEADKDVMAGQTLEKISEPSTPDR